MDKKTEIVTIASLLKGKITTIDKQYTIDCNNVIKNGMKSFIQDFKRKEVEAQQRAKKLIINS